jgi:hypothetical protein
MSNKRSRSSSPDSDGPHTKRLKKDESSSSEDYAPKFRPQAVTEKEAPKYRASARRAKSSSDSSSDSSSEGRITKFNFTPAQRRGSAKRRANPSRSPKPKKALRLLPGPLALCG